uniref:Helicase ATP-binding domain-containing protein n=1 Tax=Timema monikensis TaxID=170555 RepID=A0A7R9HIQ6_9NEOP|nr:unnamed protein product [Timema monikensis]
MNVIDNSEGNIAIIGEMERSEEKRSKRDDSLRDFERHYSSRDEGSNVNRGNFDGSEAGSSFMGQGRGRGRGGRGGHPPGLKGKDIGMWYRQKSLQNKKKEEEKFDLRLAVNLDPRRHQQIEDLLCSIRTPYLCGAQKEISKSNIFSDTLRTKGEFVKKSRTKESERLDKFSGERINNTKVPDNWDDVMEDSEACKPNLSSVSVPGASENWETTSIKYSHIGESEFKRKFLQNITGSIGSKMDNSLFMTSVLAKDSKLDESLKERLQAKQENSARYNQMLEFRKKLPSFQMRQDILQMVRENQVILISGETGCGKTTQVAQFILDDYILRGEGSTCHVVCTQPRRISATSVAERVASERDEVCGADSTGYQIRLEAKICRKKGSILFCTTGILLQWMRSDPALREVSHLVLDEIHERDVTSDFVITILKDVIPKRPNLKVILMSATLNAEQFSKYYDNCPSINIPGFTYPVEELYLEDVLHLTNFTAFKPPRQEQGWKKHMPHNKSKLRKTDEFKDFIEPYVRHLQSQKKYSSRVLECLKNPNSEDICLELVEALLHHICSTKEDGAILVFLPGWADISSLHNIITNCGSDNI